MILIFNPMSLSGQPVLVKREPGQDLLVQQRQVVHSGVPDHDPTDPYSSEGVQIHVDNVSIIDEHDTEPQSEDAHAGACWPETDSSDEDESFRRESLHAMPIPYVVVREEREKDSNTLTKSDLILSSFFKCNGFPQECAFFSDDGDMFLDHVTHVHCNKDSTTPVMLLCFYCDHRAQLTPSDLLSHLVTKHSRCRFQCNLCLFRTPHDIHLVNHFITCHFDEYEAGTQQSSSQSPVKSEFFHPERRNHQQDQAQVRGRCKVLVCDMVSHGPVFPLDNHYFDKYKADRVNNRCKEDENKYQCAFCPVMDQELWRIHEHAAHVHPHYPLLMFMPKIMEQKDKSEKLSFKQETPAAAPCSTTTTTAAIEQEQVSPQADDRKNKKQIALPNPSRRRTTIEAIPELGCSSSPANATTMAVEYTNSQEERILQNSSPDSPGQEDNFPEDHGNDYDDPMERGYITEDERKQIQTDLEMSDDEDGEDAAGPKVKRKKRKRQTFREEDDSEEDEDEEAVRKKTLRHQLKQKASESIRDRREQHTESIQRVTSNNRPGSGPELKCLLCDSRFLPVKTKFHLMSVHSTEKSLKCGDCDFIDTKAGISKHIREKHAGKGTVVKFIVNGDESEGTVIEQINVLMTNVRQANGDVRRQSIAPVIEPLIRRNRISNGNTDPGTSSMAVALSSGRKKQISSRNDREKGHMMRKMKEMQYLGPGRNERTTKNTNTPSTSQAVAVIGGNPNPAGEVD